MADLRYKCDLCKDCDSCDEEDYPLEDEYRSKFDSRRDTKAARNTADAYAKHDDDDDDENTDNEYFDDGDYEDDGNTDDFPTPTKDEDYDLSDDDDEQDDGNDDDWWSTDDDEPPMAQGRYVGRKGDECYPQGCGDEEQHHHHHDKDETKHHHGNDRDKDGHRHDRDKDGHCHDRDKDGHRHDRDKDGHCHDRDKDGHRHDRDKDGHCHDRDNDGHRHDRDKDGHRHDRDEKHRHCSDKDKNKHRDCDDEKDRGKHHDKCYPQDCNDEEHHHHHHHDQHHQCDDGQHYRKRMTCVKMPTSKKFFMTVPVQKKDRQPCKATTRLVTLRGEGRGAREYTIVTKEMEKTILGRRNTKYRGGIRGFQFVKVQKVVNCCLWRRFRHCQKKIYKQQGFVNEKMLFYGTPRVRDIVENGMHWDRHSQYGIFGRALYFAKHSTVADRYAFRNVPRDTCRRHNRELCTSCKRKIILCRVALGREKTEICKKRFDHVPRGYDSILGKPSRSLRYQASALWSGAQVYPEFVITYRIKA